MPNPNAIGIMWTLTMLMAAAIALGSTTFIIVVAAIAVIYLIVGLSVTK